MAYKILGKDKFYNTKVYGRYEDLKSCLNYLDFLKRSSVCETAKLWYEEIYYNYEVQTIYGTERKVFTSYLQAELYKKRLEKAMIERGQDAGLVEIIKFEED